MKTSAVSASHPAENVLSIHAGCISPCQPLKYERCLDDGIVQEFIAVLELLFRLLSAREELQLLRASYLIDK